MDFDGSPQTTRTLSNLMRRDPRVIRWTMLKLGERVEDIVQPRGFTTRVTQTVQDYTRS